MAVHAIAHLERSNLAHLVSRGDVSVTGRTDGLRLDALRLGEESNVGLVHETYVVGNSVHSHPVDGTAALTVFPKLYDLGEPVADCLVAGETEAGRRYRGSGALSHVSMAEGAVHAQVRNVSEVGECDGLVRPFIEAEHDRPTEPGGYYENQNEGYPSQCAEAQHAEGAQFPHLALRGFLDLKVAWNQLL